MIDRANSNFDAAANLALLLLLSVLHSLTALPYLLGVCTLHVISCILLPPPPLGCCCRRCCVPHRANLSRDEVDTSAPSEAIDGDRIAAPWLATLDKPNPVAEGRTPKAAVKRARTRGRFLLAVVAAVTSSDMVLG